MGEHGPLPEPAIRITAPEQITDDPVGPAADIFALGVLLFFAATGTPPFGDGSPQVLFTRLSEQEP